MINVYKLKDTKSKDAFKYSYLTKKFFPYLKPVLPKAILNICIAIPLGLLDGIVALSLRPYMDYVVNGDPTQTYTLFGHSIHLQSWLATIIPFGIVAFALFQGVLKYLSNYLTDWTANKMSLSLKKDLFKKLTTLDTQFFDINSSGLILTRFFTDPETASKDIIEIFKSFIMAIFGILGLVGVLLFNSWKLAIIGVTVMAIAMTPVVFIRKKIKKVS